MSADQPVDRVGDRTHAGTGHGLLERTAQQLPSVVNGAIGRRPRVDALQLDAQPEPMPRGRNHWIGANEARDPGIAAASVATGEPELGNNAVRCAALEERQPLDAWQCRVENYFVSFHFHSPCV